MSVVASRQRSLVGPLVVAGGAVAGMAYVASGRGLVGCPFHAATGLWCPGCGMTRAVGALGRGDLLGALSANLFVVVVIALAAWAWLAWVSPRLPRMSHVVPHRAWRALAIAVVAFAVLRNLPIAALQTFAP